MGDTPKDQFPQNHDFPQIPYTQLESYGDLLFSRDDFKPQVSGAIIRVGNVEISMKDEKIPDISQVNGDDSIYISLLDPTHHAALSGLSYSLSEHLNLASTGFSDGNDDFYWEANEMAIADFNNQFPDHVQSILQNRKINKIFAIKLWRKNSIGNSGELKLFFRPEYSVKNSREYELHTDQEFFKDLYNELDFEFPDHDKDIAQFTAKLALAGFPWPNRVMRD